MMDSKAWKREKGKPNGSMSDQTGLRSRLEGSMLESSSEITIDKSRRGTASDLYNRILQRWVEYLTVDPV
jgi:hypothetical protein